MTGGLVILRSGDDTKYLTWTYDVNISPPGRKIIKSCLDPFFISNEQYRENVNTHFLIPLELM
jgi:hypothetical protein